MRDLRRPTASRFDTNSLRFGFVVCKVAFSPASLAGSGDKHWSAVRYENGRPKPPAHKRLRNRARAWLAPIPSLRNTARFHRRDAVPKDFVEAPKRHWKNSDRPGSPDRSGCFAGTVKFQIIALDARPGIFPRDLPPIDASHPGLAKRIDQSTQPMFAERKGVSAQRDDDIATSRADADVQRSAIGKLSGRDGNNSQIGLTHSYCESVIRRAGIHNDEFRSGRVNLPAKKSERFAKRLALIFGTQDNRYVHKNY